MPFQSQVVKSPAALPTHIINNEPVAPVLNTVPEQTRAHEEHLLISQQQQLEQLKQQQIIQVSVLKTVFSSPLTLQKDSLELFVMEQWLEIINNHWNIKISIY